MCMESGLEGRPVVMVSFGSMNPMNLENIPKKPYQRGRSLFCSCVPGSGAPAGSMVTTTGFITEPFLHDAAVSMMSLHSNFNILAFTLLKFALSAKYDAGL